MSLPVKTRTQLITECQGLVRALAWQIHRKLPPHIDLEDLVSCGQIGLIEAARDYDPDRASQFTTYSYYRIRGAIFDGLSKMVWFRRADYDRGLYSDASRYSPSNEEPFEADNPFLVKQPPSFQDSASAGTLGCVSWHQLDDAESTYEKRSFQSPPDAVIQREMLGKLHELLETLPENARSLIHGTYFEGLSLKDAGTRIGISKAWASRLHAKTLKELAKSFRICSMAD